jgi:DHA2 family multidrug resistance protein-like MFS transporter
MQSVLGALLSVRYASYFTKAFATLPPAQQQALSQETATMLKSSFGGAAKVAELYPGNAELIMSGAKEAFTKGSVLAIGAALVAVVVGLVLIIVFFPGKGKELELEAAYAREDAGDSSGVPGDIILSS